MERIKYAPERGDLIKLNFSPTVGHEQHGYRPAVILSAKNYNTLTRRAIVCPITSKIYRYPFVTIIDGKVKGSILVDQVRTIDWVARRVKYVGECPAEVLLEVSEKLSVLIGVE